MVNTNVVVMVPYGYFAVRDDIVRATGDVHMLSGSDACGSVSDKQQPVELRCGPNMTATSTAPPCEATYPRSSMTRPLSRTWCICVPKPLSEHQAL